MLFLYFIAWDSLSVPAAILEHLKANAAAKRSRQLLKRSGYHPSGTGTIWALYFMLVILMLVLDIGLYASFELLSINEHVSNFFGQAAVGTLFLKALDLIPPFLTIWTLIPVWASVITIVYYERKIRLEGFDIDVLASEIDHGKASDNLF